MNSGCEIGNCNSTDEATGNICSIYKIKQINLSKTRA